MLSLLLAKNVAPTPDFAVHRLGGNFPDLEVDLYLAAPPPTDSFLLRWWIDNDSSTLYPTDQINLSESPAQTQPHTLSLRFNQTLLPHCVTPGSHSLSFQLSPLSADDSSPIATATFSIPPDHACCSLSLISTGGTFPDLRVTFLVTISSPYAGFFRWGVDHYFWVPVRNGNSEFPVTSSRTDRFRWSASGLRKYFFAPGLRSMSIQFHSPHFQHSPEISVRFILTQAFGSPPSARLLLDRRTGVFPDIRVYFRAVVNWTYSGVLHWRLDDDPWMEYHRSNARVVISERSTALEMAEWSAPLESGFTIDPG
jgi:hypothetical protein